MHDYGTSAAVIESTLTACLVGLAGGQALGGPLSDAPGRRRPLVFAALGYVAASALCAWAPNVALLAGARFLQGLAGGTGMVVGYAVVRDRFSGIAMVRFFSALVIFTMLPALLAPTIGSQILRVTNWHGVFLVLAGLGLLLLVAIQLWLPETLPEQRRRRAGAVTALRTMASRAADRRFLGYALPTALAGGALCAYVSASSFIFQRVYGVSPQDYGVLFGLNGLVFALAGQVNGVVVGLVSSWRLFRFGLVLQVCTALVVLIVVLVGGLGLTAILLPLFCAMGSNGFVQPNGTALSLNDRAEMAGSAAAVLGTLRFAFGAAAAPLVSIGGGASALPMALTMVSLAAASGLLFVLLRPGPPVWTADHAEA